MPRITEDSVFLSFVVVLGAQSYMGLAALALSMFVHMAEWYRAAACGEDSAGGVRGYGEQHMDTGPSSNGNPPPLKASFDARCPTWSLPASLLYRSDESSISVNVVCECAVPIDCRIAV